LIVGLGLVLLHPVSMFACPVLQLVI